MDTLPFRQIHLDFHTGDQMPDVGSRFTEENFKEALRTGHVSSITLFAKCHHGWSYFPSRVNSMHPTLRTNLLDRQLRVCEELGVRTQIYISAGFDEHIAVTHPDYRTVIRGGDNTMLGTYFHQLCLNNQDYLHLLCAEVAEVMQIFGERTDGIFMDICTPTPCVCPACINDMLEKGMDPENPADVIRHGRMVYDKYTGAINDTVAFYNPRMPVFHNCGNLPRDDRAWAFTNTAHMELESLPTGGWGYDHFPMSAAYCRVLGREFLGMTGKFHKSWGEFGGYKHPNALIYETSLSLAMGARCSVGDQLHPLGEFDMATYRLIGAAYAEVEKKEPWCHDVRAVADVAVYTTYTDATRNTCPDIGANRMLLEGHYLYNIIDDQCAFEDYKVVIFPDIVRFDDALAEKVRAYLARGGKILLSGQSGLCGGDFFADFGVTMHGENPMDATYLCPTYDMQGNGMAAYLMYRRGYRISVADGVQVLAGMQDAYFNRSFRRFCSHANTPYDPSPRAQHPGVVLSGQIGYIAWHIFDEYRVHGAYHHKQMVCDLLDALLGDSKTLTTNLPSGGVTTLMYQPTGHRLVNHLLYAATKLRGTVEVIEDAIPLRDVQVTLHLPRNTGVERVYLAPSGEALPFTHDTTDRGDILTYTLAEFTFHAMAVIEGHLEL